MKYRVDKNIPTPRSKRSMEYPLSEMEIGDSFHFVLRRLKSVRNATRIFAQMKFTTHKVSETHGRCWRIR